FRGLPIGGAVLEESANLGRGGTSLVLEERPRHHVGVVRVAGAALALLRPVPIGGVQECRRLGKGELAGQRFIGAIGFRWFACRAIVGTQSQSPPTQNGSAAQENNP